MWWIVGIVGIAAIAWGIWDELQEESMPRRGQR
jgi:hypothetical protein